ncbi:S-adenosyl-L-methionine-dependent methyltransferase-20 [Coleophoma cylindrospora]|uniref:S-adenosyl-L-methionine-dependent methyltransferase-20 n=1 Tax=Coleophoma cylindrospora TaxID=1849047 RepID=A0A3D8RZU7_9HELO|nr:S-adenosyl-L-methionine-dependent methyltransferase-20 [Coleophoma cylindrospora]
MTTEPQAANSPGPASPGPVEAEADNWDDDSAVGGVSLASSKTSITSSILRYREENGRTYHGFKDGQYAFPNDEPENDRLDLQHHVFMLTLGGKLFSAPIPKEQNLHRVLDVGTGTGIWAVDFADEHPESEVIGVDLSPIQPRFVPPNLIFEIDDLEEPWTFSKPFDFIMARLTVQFFADPARFMQQAFGSLSLGGWIECIDIVNPSKSDDHPNFQETHLWKWGHYRAEAAKKLRGSVSAAKCYKEQMEAAGFVNVKEIIYKWPTNRWPKDKKLKELGMWVNEDIQPALEGLSYATFTRGLGWSKEEIEVFLTGVRRDMNDTKIHAYWEIYAVSGQKPS